MESFILRHVDEKINEKFTNKQIQLQKIFGQKYDATFEQVKKSNYDCCKISAKYEKVVKFEQIN